MSDLFEKTQVHFLKCSTILLIYIGYSIIVSAISKLPFILRDILGPSTVSVSAVGLYGGTVFPIIFLCITPFIIAGIYGLTFRRLHSQGDSLNQFFSLAKKNYLAIFKITLIISFIHLIYGSILMVATTGIDQFVTLQKIGATTLSLIINIVFVFAYPLVIVGFFLNQNLKPIRSSISMVMHNLKKIKFIIALLILNTIISIVSKIVLVGTVGYFIKILLPIITTPITFIALIYSYLLIIEYFYKDLTFDFPDNQ